MAKETSGKKTPPTIPTMVNEKKKTENLEIMAPWWWRWWSIMKRNISSERKFSTEITEEKKVVKINLTNLTTLRGWTSSIAIHNSFHHFTINPSIRLSISHLSHYHLRNDSFRKESNDCLFRFLSVLMLLSPNELFWSQNSKYIRSKFHFYSPWLHKI